MANPNELGHGEGALTRAAQLVTDAKQKFERQSDTLEGQIADLKGRWEGDGGRAFHLLHAAWTEKHKVVVTALDKFAASLTETEKDNVAIDQQAGAGMNALINKLGQLS